jgi:hypothetical protein
VRQADPDDESREPTRWHVIDFFQKIDGLPFTHTVE